MDMMRRLAVEALNFLMEVIIRTIIQAVSMYVGAGITTRLQSPSGLPSSTSSGCLISSM
jgi:hypothetical protein